MKNVILVTVLLFVGMLLTSKSMAQTKRSCLGVVENIEDDLDDLDPGEQINQKLFEYCDELRSLISGGATDSWYTIQKYLKQIEDIVEDAKRGRCSGSDCTKVKSNVQKIRREVD